MPRQRKPKPVVPRRAWALVKPNGHIELDTVEPTRKDAIWEGCSWHWKLASDEVWASHRAEGWRVVRVEIREVPHGKAK